MTFDSFEKQPIESYYVPIVAMAFILFIISVFMGIAAQDIYEFTSLLIGLAIIVQLPYTIYRWLRYSNYRYSISQNKITVERGVFSKDTLSVLFNLVNDVNVNEPLLFRSFDIAKIQFSTSTNYNIEIFLPKQDAIALQNLMTSQMAVNRVGVIK